MEGDREWQQRVRLSGCLLLETIDWWCRSDSDFPLDGTIASMLYLFSPRFDPFKISETKIRQRLLNVVGTPSAEYSQTWPLRDEAERSELIDTISEILSGAVDRWNNGALDPSIETVNQQIVDQVVAQKYVVIHHNQTTKRDYGGFYGNY